RGATRIGDQVWVVGGVSPLGRGRRLPGGARRWKTPAPAEPLEIVVETAPLEELHAELLQAQVPDGSRLQGVEVFELRLPAQANLALIVRDGQGPVPGPTTVLRTGDRLLIVVPAAVRERT